MSHPIHPAIVHLPIACLVLATVADIGGWYLGEQVAWMASILMFVGIATAFFAMLAGFIELSKVSPDSPAMRTANQHVTLMITAWSFYLVSLYLRIKNDAFSQPGWMDVTLSCLGFLFLFTGGWLGGKLVYEHGIGVKKPNE